MGADFSAMQRSNAHSYNINPIETKWSVGSSGQVLEFHSTARWNAHFEASKETSKLMVIDFTASWCVPCRFMEPAMNEFAAKYTDVDFIKIDVDELMDVANEYGVQAMPTFILIKKGRVVDKVTGVRKEELQKKIETHRAYTYNYSY